MLFKKWKQKAAKASDAAFEDAFTDRVGQSPVEFVFAKLSVGSDKNAVEYLYDITAAEIARRNHCTPKPFSFYFPEAEKKFQAHLQKKEKDEAFLLQYERIQRNIGICQREFLNRKDTRPFGAQYVSQMDLLFADRFFCDKIMQIAKENAKFEFCDDAQSPEFLKFKREILPQRMAELGLTEHPTVRSICDCVTADGKSLKSALITIYYAVRMCILQRSISS